MSKFLSMILTALGVPLLFWLAYFFYWFETPEVATFLRWSSGFVVMVVAIWFIGTNEEL